jgi:excisionase family DNA binding protein
MYIDIYQLREELNRVFDQKAEEFFNRIYGKQKGEEYEESDLITIEEAADFFKVSRTTLNNWIKNNKIISVKSGNRRLFSKEYIKRYKEANFNYNVRIRTNPNKHV